MCCTLCPTFIDAYACCCCCVCVCCGCTTLLRNLCVGEVAFDVDDDAAAAAAAAVDDDDGVLMSRCVRLIIARLT